MRIVVIIVAAAVLAGAGMIALGGSPPAGLSGEHLDRLRGMDAYYVQDQDQETVRPLEIRLQGEPVTFLLLGITFTYRRGLETKNPEILLEAHRRLLVDRLTVHLCSLRRADFEDSLVLYRLKRDLRRIIETVVFPGREARVERIWFDPFLFQQVE